MSETPIAAAIATPIPTPVSTPSSPTTPNVSNAKKFEGDGQIFKAKLIGMEDLSIDRDEKICLDSMFKLKAVVRARGEHKQRIQLNLTMSAVKVFDDITKAQIASHEIERISFVVIDPRDNRAFGYVYNTTDDRHQFWAIKTERAAAATVLALKELFELAFEQFSNAEKSKDETNNVSTPASPTQVTTSTQQSSATNTAVSSPPPPVPVVSNPTPSLIDDAIWAPSITPIVTQTTNSEVSLWDTNEPVVQPPPKPVDSLDDFLGDLVLTPPTTQPPTSTPSNDLFAAFSNVASTPAPPPPVTSYNNFYNQPIQPNLMNSTSSLLPQPQRPSTPSTMPLFPQQQQQPNLLAPASLSPVAPPSVTSPFAGFDLLGGASSGTGVKTTKDLFRPAPTPAKTMQQLLLEKQRNPFAQS